MRPLLPLLTLALLPSLALAQQPEPGYHLPAPELVRLVDAPTTPEMWVDPTAKRLLLATKPYLLSLEDLSQPELKLAGMRFNPRNRASGRDKYYTQLALRPLMDSRAKPRVLAIPGKPHILQPTWSGDGSRLAFVNVQPNEAQLWVAESDSGKCWRVPGVQLQGCSGFDINWMPDGRTLLVLARPLQPGQPPQAPEVPSGPSIQEHQGGKASARTYQDLLRSTQDEKTFEYYLTSQVLKVREDGKEIQALTPPALYTSVSCSPNGQFFLVNFWHRPFSYVQTASSFPLKTEVLDARGKTVRVLRDLPLEENTPPDFDAVRRGPRAVQWRSDVPATLFWTEALDEGDARKAADFREQTFFWSPLQGGQPQPWIRLKDRFRSVEWGDGSHALLSEGWWKTRRSKTHWVQPDVAEAPPVTVVDRSTEDRYNDPGAPLSRTLPNGYRVLMVGQGDTLYYRGEGASPEGDRPFLDRLNLKTREKQRIFRSAPPQFERPFRVLDEHHFLSTRETRETPANLVFHTDQNEGQPLTDFPNPAPQLAGVKKEILRYKRQDGVELTGTLYTPPGYDCKKDGPLPIFIWAYPGEVKNAALAGQVKDSPCKFLRPWWGGPLFFAMRGYAVLEDPTFPIIGEGEQQPNDTYVEQLVMDAQAAIDAVVATGAGDRRRCAIGGHSYGAFTTANLLAHSNLFRAGIARSGAYNRTLTPFGFQSEERIYWEARDTYTRMSPFTYADKIDEPILLIHGQEDDNPGTFPIQSERLFQAIKGLGGRARLVTLPKESHGYASRESVLHVLWEMDQWLEKHVKNAPL